MVKSIHVWFFVLLVSACTEVNKGKAEQNQKSVNNDKLEIAIAGQIDSLYVVDQKIQQRIIEANRNDEEEMRALYAEEKATFKRHIPILKNIHSKIGYPTIDKVGQESSSRYFTLVQHSDADLTYQQEMLSLIKIEVQSGNVKAKDFAFLTDRVELANHNPQVYGTQVDFNTDIGQAFPKELFDSAKVNERRSEIGLESLETYLNKNSQMHFQMNKERYEKMGIKEAPLYKTE